MIDDLRRAAVQRVWDGTRNATTCESFIAVYDTLRAWDATHSIGRTVAAEAAAHSRPLPRRVRWARQEAGGLPEYGTLIAISDDGSIVYVKRNSPIPGWYSASEWIEIDPDPIPTAPAAIKITDEMVDRAAPVYTRLVNGPDGARVSVQWHAMRAALIAALSPEAT